MNNMKIQHKAYNSGPDQSKKKNQWDWRKELWKYQVKGEQSKKNEESLYDL